MIYTYDQIFTKNDELLNRLIAEHIMGEPEPAIIEHYKDFSEKGWWICIRKADSNECEWSPINFVGNMKWCWQVIKQIRMESPTVRDRFRYYLEQLRPLEAETETEACRKICRAALLSRLDKIPKPI